MNILKIIMLIGIVLLAGCDDATTVSHNLSKAAQNFEVDRRVIFYNGITDTYMLTVEGRCAIEDQGHQLESDLQGRQGRVQEALSRPVR